jgi:hypothetical protein
MASSATAHSRSYSSPDVKVLGCRPLANDATRFGGRRTKTSKGRNRGKGTYWAVPRAQLWGFGRGGATSELGGAAGWAVAMALRLRCGALL